MKNKFIAIFVIMTLIALSFSAVQAGKIQKIEKNDEKIPIEIGTITEDGKSICEKFLLSEEQIVELETFFSAITQQMESASSWEEIKEIIDKIPENNGLISGLISKIIKKIKYIINSIISYMKLYYARGFVISFGHNYKFNPFMKSKIKLTKTFCMWRYSNKAIGKTILKDRTIIFKTIKDPLANRIKVLKGIQFGYMAHFFGLYIHLARKLPAKSSTFFLGTARYINGLQLSLI